MAFEDFLGKTVAFLDNETSLNDTQKRSVSNSFDTIRSYLYEYGALVTNDNMIARYSPAQFEAVGHSKKPLIPMMISILPPDNYPSGEFTTRRIPAPAEVPFNLSRMAGGMGTRKLFGAQRDWNDKSSSNPSDMTTIQPLPEIPDSSKQLTKDELREEAEERAKRDELLKDIRENVAKQEAVDAERLAEDRSRNYNTIETKVSIRDMNGPTEKDCIDTLKDRYKAFQKHGRSSLEDLDNKITPIVYGRSEVKDNFAQHSADIRAARTMETNVDYLRQQVITMQNLPPFFMYINPSEFSLSYEHIISDSNRSRTGFIVEHWGLNQPKISFSGSIGATLINSMDRNGRPSGGLTRYHRRESASYQSLMTLFNIYKNNAYIYNVDNTISMMGSVQLFYDNVIYTGSFDTLTISETEDSPFNMKFSCTFTIRFMQDIS